MRLLSCVVTSILLAKSSFALSASNESPSAVSPLLPLPSPEPTSLARRSPQRDDDDPDNSNIFPDPPLEQEFGPDGRITRTTTFLQGPRTTTIRGEPGRTSTVTRRTTITRGAPGPSPAPPRPGQCPRVWFDISRELTGLFVEGADCGRFAHGAIRAIFHDCFPAGGCDGSLVLAEEISRPNNVPMQPTMNVLMGIAVKYSVTAADMLAFAACKPCRKIFESFVTDTALSTRNCLVPRRSSRAHIHWTRRRNGCRTRRSTSCAQRTSKSRAGCIPVRRPRFLS